MTTRISVAFFLIFVPFIICFPVTYCIGSQLGQSQQKLKLERENNERNIRLKRALGVLAKCQDFEGEISSVFRVSDHVNMLRYTQDTNDSWIAKEKKRLDFYVSANGGKVYFDSSEVLVKGIRSIGKKVLALAEGSYGGFLLNLFLGDEIKNIKKFNGEIYFQWLSSLSVGCYAGQNGRVDFETVFSKINIRDSNFPPIFAESASISAFLLNFYYNPSIWNIKFTPYIGLGIGSTVFRLKRIEKPSKNLMPLNIPWLAYQIKFGADYSIIPEVKTFFGYRYFNIPTPITDDVSTHTVEVGLIFNF